MTEQQGSQFFARSKIEGPSEPGFWGSEPCMGLA